LQKYLHLKKVVQVVILMMVMVVAVVVVVVVVAAAALAEGCGRRKSAVTRNSKYLELFRT
jgi:hypothetical protein